MQIAEWYWGLPVLGLGVLFAGAGAAHVGHARSSRDWPEVRGRVTRCEKRNPPPGRRTRGRVSFDFEYEYHVDGVVHRCRNIDWGMRQFTPSGVEDFLRRYPVGTSVRVFHHPTKPKVAVLEHGMSLGSFLFLGVGIALVGAGAFVLLCGQGGRWALTP